MLAKNDPITARRARPLLRRTPLLPGESLPSLLERLAQLNHYPHSGVLSRVCHERLEAPANQDSIFRPKWVQTFLMLAELSQVPVEELLEASDHRFVLVLTPPGQEPVRMPWMGTDSRPMVTPILANSHLRPASAAQFCPLCLKRSSCHRLSWVPVAATICLEHACLLVPNCPQCKERISVSEIVKRSCRTCLADLRTAEALSVAGDTLGILSQQVIQHWLSVAPAPGLPDGHNLPDQPPVVLYHLLEDLCRRWLALQSDWPALPPPLKDLADHIPVHAGHQQRLAPAQVYHLHRLAFSSLLDWPQGLFRFLDALQNYNSSGQTQRFKAIRRDWFQEADPASPFVFVQQAFLEYLRARHIPPSHSMVKQFKEVFWFVEQTGLWTEEHTAQVLGVSTQDLRRFFPYGPLKACLWSRSPPNMPVFDRDKVLALQQKWKVGWSIFETSSWLGLTHTDVVRLVECGELNLVNGLDGDGGASWVITRRSVEDFFEKVANRLELFQGDPHNLTCLDDAAYDTSLLGIDRVELLQGVAAGVLPAYKREPEIRRLERLCFLDAMVVSLPDLIYAQRGWIAGHKFAHEKGISPGLVMDWVEAGLIRPEAIFGPHRYFVRQDLEQLAARLTASS